MSEPKESSYEPVEDANNTVENESKPTTENITLQPMSKRQKKRIQKLADWEVKKKVKRVKEREKYKKKKAEAIAIGIAVRTGASRKELKLNKVNMSDNFLKVIVDLDYDDLMIDKDISKCVKQLLRIYTINRRSSRPSQIYFTGIKKNGRIHQTLEKNDGYQNWDVNWHFEPYLNIVNKAKIIYLTSDSNCVLTELEEDAFYVIGGIVDHNHHKGLCYDRAQKLDLRTARLPLNENVDIKTRTVLSTVHVFEMLLRVSEGNSWLDTILNILPMRKGAKAKECQSFEDGSRLPIRTTTTTGGNNNSSEETDM